MHPDRRPGRGTESARKRFRAERVRKDAEMVRPGTPPIRPRTAPEEVNGAGPVLRDPEARRVEGAVAGIAGQD
jgi:hypothetical protein